MPADPLAIRVARRHAARHQGASIRPAVPTTTTRLDFGTVFGIELRMLLEPLMGYVAELRFLRVPDGPTSTVAWEGATETGERISGQLLLHASAAENEVAVWGEVAVDPAP
jgi:hypothetical protein